MGAASAAPGSKARGPRRSGRRLLSNRPVRRQRLGRARRRLEHVAPLRLPRASREPRRKQPHGHGHPEAIPRGLLRAQADLRPRAHSAARDAPLRRKDRRSRGGRRRRSEEHTSELQSHSDLVCRLLLEKKKKNHTCTLILKKQNNEKQ